MFGVWSEVERKRPTCDQVKRAEYSNKCQDPHGLHVNHFSRDLGTGLNFNVPYQLQSMSEYDS